jgi:hypothetical protein
MRIKRYMGGDPCKLTREIGAGNGMGVMNLLDTRLCTWLMPLMGPASIAYISYGCWHQSHAVSNDGSKTPARGGRQK